MYKAALNSDFQRIISPHILLDNLGKVNNIPYYVPLRIFPEHQQTGLGNISQVNLVSRDCCIICSFSYLILTLSPWSSKYFRKISAVYMRKSTYNQIISKEINPRVIWYDDNSICYSMDIFLTPLLVYLRNFCSSNTRRLFE